MLRYRFRYSPGEDRVQFHLARDDVQFACWLTRRQCMSWLYALERAKPDATSPAASPSSGAGPKAQPLSADVPIQTLKNLVVRATSDGVSVTFKPLDGESMRFSQGSKLAEQVYHKLYSLALRADWEPEPALRRLAHEKKREETPSAPRSLH